MSRKDLRLRYLRYLPLFSLLLIPTPILAQQTASASGIEDIIVTAQRREQNLQNVPVAVTALGGAQIQARQLNSLDQISGLAPNLTLNVANASSATSQVSLRGTVTTNSSIIYDPAVGMYLDGVYIGKATGSIFDIGDLERIEVLRGPQGTLFGRNTLAGAVSFVTRKPSDTLRIEGEAGYGNYNAMHFRGLVNMPLSDTLFVKVAGQIQRRDGFSKAVPDPFGLFPSESGDLDTRRRESLIAQLRWQATPDLTLDYMYDYSHMSENPMTVSSGIAAGGFFDPTSPSYIGIPLYQYVVNGENRPRTISLDRLPREKARTYGHALNLSYDLGGITLKSITAYRNTRYTQEVAGLDMDGSPIPLTLAGFNVRYKQFSQELQASGRAVDDRLNYVAGFYYFRDNGFNYNPQSYFFGSSEYMSTYGVRSKAFALYGQADFKLTDALTVTGGVRWTSERKQLVRYYEIIADPAAPPGVYIDIDRGDDVAKTFRNINPVAILSYQFTPDINAYVKYSVGFRSGNFNGEAATDVDARSFYKPEKNKSWEVGLKTRWFDQRLQINIAAFYDTQVDKQVSVFLATGSAATLNRNAGRARIKGLEFEVDARPFDALHLYGSLGLLRTRFLEYIDAGRDVADNRFFAKAPRTTFTLGGDLTVYEGHGNVTLSGDVSYRSSHYALPGQYVRDPSYALVATADELRISKQTLVNARLRWDAIPMGQSGLEAYAMLWGKNLLNRRAIVNKMAFGPNFGGLVDSNYGEPRTYGMTVGFKF